MPIDASLSRTHKSCDACTNRKVRCSGSPGPCTNCVRRKAECNFSVRKLGRKPNVAKQFMAINGASEPTGTEGTVSVFDFASPPSVKPPRTSDADPTPPSVGPDAERAGPHRIADLYVDRVLERAEEDPTSSHAGSAASKYVRANGIFGGDHSLTFFSEGRLKSLSQCLGHEKVSELVARIHARVQERTRATRELGSNVISRQAEPPACLKNKKLTSKYIQLYFERCHPRFTFLDRAAFEATASSQSHRNDAPRSKSWSALYHTVLAIGSQYDGRGTFEPGKGESWELFSVALANFTDLMLLPDSLTTLQALTAMVIYSCGVSGIGLENIIMSEAVRRAQNLVDARFSGYALQSYRKTFWSLYALEKVTSFHHGRCSHFVDCDISCPIPPTPESNFGGFNWFLSFVRHGRLLSRAYTSLFSVGVSDNSDEYFLDIIDQLTEELEEWRASLPDNGFKPGGVIKPHAVNTTPNAQAVAVLMHFFYNSFLLTITRMALRHLPSSNDSARHYRREEALATVEKTSRSLLELTSIIDVAPYTPMWMLVGIPISGFFVLFDLIIHNPRQPQAITNLALLDMVAGHCSSLEYMSKGEIPGSLIGEFAYIARSYVNDVNSRTPTGDTPQQPTLSTSQGPISQPQWSLPHGDVHETPSMEVTGDFSDMSLTVEAGPMDIEGLPLAPNTFLGTDVMNLFGYWFPDVEPLFYQTPQCQNDLLQFAAQQDQSMTPDQ